MTPDDARAVVLWRYPQVACGGDSAWEDTPPNAGWLDYTVEYRALPVAAYDALVAEVAALKQERDAMREALVKLLGCLQHARLDGDGIPEWHTTFDSGWGVIEAMDEAQAALDAAKARGA
jgi:hypothetical protein